MISFELMSFALGYYLVRTVYFSFLSAYLWLVSIIAIGIVILWLGAWAGIFHDNGIARWKILIPFYNIYTCYKMVNCVPLLILTIITYLAFVLMPQQYVNILRIAFYIGRFYFFYNLSARFGRSIGFAILLFIFHPLPLFCLKGKIRS